MNILPGITINLLFESRSSVILYNFLIGLSNKKPFILPANICPIVIATFEKAKVPYSFIDICLKTYEMDKFSLLKKIKKSPDYFGGVLWVRGYGNNSENRN